MPVEQGYWRYVEGVAAQVCRLYGYQRIDTPIFEETSLFARSVGESTDIVEKEMYSFQDRGGGGLTLRPEGTAAICRAYLEHGMHNLPQPVRLHYLGPIFRYERPQAGRYRQHQQLGCEAIGEQDAAVDVEIVNLAWRFLHRLGLGNLVLYLNSVGCPRCRPGYLVVLKDHYEPHLASLCPECRTRFHRNPLRLLDCKKDSCQPVADGAPPMLDYLCDSCAPHFQVVREGLEMLGIPFQSNHRLVRGLDYYTKTVFEIQPGGGGAQSTIAGGGRYDGLIEELGGRPTPGVGFATGIERIILNLKSQGVALPNPHASPIFVAYLGEAARRDALKLLEDLRQGGIAAVSAFGDRSLKAQLRQANALGVSHTLILGEEELKTGTVLLRTMAQGKQERVPREAVLSVAREGSLPLRGD
ncbi:MAG: histidine--tRNA ligase [Chloroflexi bacterium]|nr:histidine--tRNA ligase [Chloroflexota bacterium]